MRSTVEAVEPARHFDGYILLISVLYMAKLYVRCCSVGRLEALAGLPGLGRKAHMDVEVAKWRRKGTVEGRLGAFKVIEMAFNLVAACFCGPEHTRDRCPNHHVHYAVPHLCFHIVAVSIPIRLRSSETYHLENSACLPSILMLWTSAGPGNNR